MSIPAYERIFIRKTTLIEHRVRFKSGENALKISEALSKVPVNAKLFRVDFWEDNGQWHELSFSEETVETEIED